MSFLIEVLVETIVIFSFYLNLLEDSRSTYIIPNAPYMYCRYIFINIFTWF